MRRREAWEGNVSPILHFTGSQSQAPNWVREQKVAAFGATSPREQASLYPPLAKGVPVQPASSLHTHSPSPSSNREPKSPYDKGDTTRRVRNSNSTPRAGTGLRRSEIIPGGREGKSGGGWGSLTAVRPGRRLPASHHGPGGKGERGGGLRDGSGAPARRGLFLAPRAEGRDQECPSRPERAPL